MTTPNAIMRNIVRFDIVICNSSCFRLNIVISMYLSASLCKPISVKLQNFRSYKFYIILLYCLPLSFS